MLFSSSVFLFLFLPIVLLGYYGVCTWLGPLRRPAQNLLLLAASLFFYAWGEPWFVLVMIASILANYLFGLWVGLWRTRGRSTRLPAGLAVAANLGLFFVFKYLAFVLTEANRLGLGLTVPIIDLPIGISFFTFQAMSYVLDVGRGRGKVQRNPLKVALYISFFPQLIAGPIVKYETVAEDIDCRRESWEDFSSGVCRFLTGLGKKVFLSNQLAVLVDFVYGLPAAGLSAGLAWLSSLCYILQLYFDFSGYSDMAIGLGRMFGFHFLENFNYPFISRSITEFWRRWHISLSTWFLDYVYVPLGGSRVSAKWKHVRNLFIVWLLTGLWHGANWTFLFWGLYSFSLLALEKFGGFGTRWPGWCRWLYTLIAFDIGCVFFRADSLGAAFLHLKAMFFPAAGWWDSYTLFFLTEYRFLLLAAALCATPIARWLSARLASAGRGGALVRDTLYPLAVLTLYVVCAAFIVKGTYNPFIYFNF
ncbi:MBOAT family protein [Pseudoflavonifractor sp. 524-17]|uniref:MBOAT family O-acyltransferase n=1 Tax=Pseudoflavonifractor sp. 524-17 TaxID=2304577 RepID=UPI0013795AB7|nr:MBOAT family protein [Pseudoflavonifractor sp. 524-17]